MAGQGQEGQELHIHNVTAERETHNKNHGREKSKMAEKSEPTPKQREWFGFWSVDGKNAYEPPSQ